jgi:CheY-like chemotaxis protein
MPNLDGAEALAQLRMQAGPSRHAIALATTADNGRETHAALLAAGFVEVLIKPIGFGALRAALDRHVRVSSRASTPECAIAPLDDQRALAAAGGDADIVRALRGLLARELDALPAEFAAADLQRAVHALHERLHRLDASAGFCGVPSLLHASAKLRTALDAPAWPDRDIADFLAVCARARAMLPGD